MLLLYSSIDRMLTIDYGVQTTGSAGFRNRRHQRSCRSGSPESRS